MVFLSFRIKHLSFLLMTVVLTSMAYTSLRYFKQVLSGLTQFEISEEDCLNAAGLSKMPESNRVNANILAHLLSFAASHLDDAMIGIKCGLKYPILQYNRPTEFLKFCENIAHAADVYKAYCPIFHTIGTPSGVISENETERILWIPNLDQEPVDDFYHLIELIMTNYLTSINWLAWKTPNAVKQVNIAHEASLPLKAYQDVMNCDVKFGQKEYSLILQDGVKDVPFATANQAEFAKVKIKFDLILNELLEAESLIDHIELQIRRMIEYEAPNKASKASVAEALGLSQQSLGRL